MSDSSTKLTKMDDKTNHEKEEKDTTTTSSSSSSSPAKRKTGEGASLSSTDSGNKKPRVADSAGSTIEAGEDLLPPPPLDLKKIARVDLERLALSAVSVLQGGGGGGSPSMSILKKTYENLVLQENAQKEREELFYQNKDIWVENILPFVGPGHFIYVAGVSKKFKEYYLEYFDTLKEKAEISIPKVYEIKDDERFPYDDGFLDSIQEDDEYDPNEADCFLVKDDDEDTDRRFEREAKPTDTFYSVAFATVATTVFWDNATLKSPLRLPNNRVCRKMAKYECFESLKWAYEQRRFKWGHLTTAWAAANGRLDMLKFANENGCPMNKITSFWGASSGNLEIVKYIRNNNIKHTQSGRTIGITPWDERTSAQAAKVGNLDVLKWIREEQDPPCPWDSNTSTEAAAVGNLEVLIYCHQNGCPWDSGVCTLAANLEILKYAHRNGCPWNALTTKVFVRRGGDLAMLQYAHDNGCPLHKHVCIKAANLGYLEILKYARSKGYRHWKWKEICASAAKGAHFHVIKWLLDNDGCPQKFRDTMVDKARENGCQFPPGY